MSMALPALTPTQESLFLTLGGRALDSRLPRPFLGRVPGLKLVEEIFLTRAPEVAEFSRITRVAMAIDLAARSATVSRMVGTTLVCYRF